MIYFTLCLNFSLQIHEKRKVNNETSGNFLILQRILDARGTLKI